MPKDDAIYLGNMLDSARKIEARVQSHSRTEYDANEDSQIVLAFLIQNIGESASRVSIEFRE